MWPYDYVNPMIPCFQGAKAAAANVPQPGEHGDYTADMFREDFPQFYNDGDPPAPLLPDAMLQIFMEQANDSVLPSRWGSMWRETHPWAMTTAPLPLEPRNGEPGTRPSTERSW